MSIRTTPLAVAVLLAALVSAGPPASAAATPAVVAVGANESVRTEITVPVSAPGADPAPPINGETPAASATDAAAQVEPDSEAEAGRLAFVLIPLIAAAIIVIGGIIVISRGRRGRRGD